MNEKCFSRKSALHLSSSEERSDLPYFVSYHLIILIEIFCSFLNELKNIQDKQKKCTRLVQF